MLQYYFAFIYTLTKFLRISLNVRHAEKHFESKLHTLSESYFIVYKIFTTSSWSRRMRWVRYVARKV